MYLQDSFRQISQWLPVHTETFRDEPKWV